MPLIGNNKKHLPMRQSRTPRFAGFLLDNGSDKWILVVFWAQRAEAKCYYQKIDQKSNSFQIQLRTQKLQPLSREKKIKVQAGHFTIIFHYCWSCALWAAVLVKYQVLKNCFSSSPGRTLTFFLLIPIKMPLNGFWRNLAWSIFCDTIWPQSTVG